ncbi:Repeat domain in Vibrio, Colwellia, Bradyrhizobium and Shewanella [uncultured Caudovirales phage]|uniref:Repeat domain in Vibrio, Colwellia, Bradyrhizobium and Shewanella n=1 Tax=uncultured Caudovirales phage TaxID=2100421 RepID=A0A6J5T9R0_9CAUD|nr:Repeat domain in Vibrio, Colwellia, Bradyrhizobium and Shewanella [uncultured Caudovirales phage]
MKHYITSVCLSSLLIACGGGGGSTSSAATPVVNPGPVAPSTISVSSYINSKENSFFSNDFPKDADGVNPLPADAFAFFKYADGSQGVVAERNLYNLQTETPSTATRGKITFYKKINNQWQLNPITVIENVRPCVHARKLLATDFNNDGIMDFAITCHGWDATPFPGEQSVVLLSQGAGYVLNSITATADFYHGGSTSDFNNDGYPDIALTTHAGIKIFLNDKTGKFVESTDYTVPQSRHPFHVELFDMSGDGKFDLIAGGHEWDDSTRIIINPGDNKFANGRTIIVPTVPGAGVIVDFVYIKSNNSVYILRTGDGQNNGTVFYEGLWIQKFSLDSNTSTVIYANQAWTDNRYNWPRKWLVWLDEEGGYIVSNWGSAIRLLIN